MTTDKKGLGQFVRSAPTTTTSPKIGGKPRPASTIPGDGGSAAPPAGTTKVSRA